MANNENHVLSVLCRYRLTWRQLVWPDCPQTQLDAPCYNNYSCTTDQCHYKQLRFLTTIIQIKEIITMHNTTLVISGNPPCGDSRAKRLCFFHHFVRKEFVTDNVHAIRCLTHGLPQDWKRHYGSPRTS